MSSILGKKYAVLFIILSAALSACSTVTPYEGGDPRWANFKSWTKITEEEGKNTGDPTGFIGNVHKGREGYRDVYVNDTGLAMATSEGPYNYPVGTVVVKEQFDDEAAWLSQEPTELTIMLKLQDNGELDASNWGYVVGYMGEVKDNKFCSSCHSIVKSDDFIFTNQTLLSK